MIFKLSFIYVLGDNESILHICPWWQWNYLTYMSLLKMKLSYIYVLDDNESILHICPWWKWKYLACMSLVTMKTVLHICPWLPLILLDPRPYFHEFGIKCDNPELDYRTPSKFFSCKWTYTLNTDKIKLIIIARTPWSRWDPTWLQYLQIDNFNRPGLTL